VKQDQPVEMSAAPAIKISSATRDLVEKEKWFVLSAIQLWDEIGKHFCYVGGGIGDDSLDTMSRSKGSFEQGRRKKGRQSREKFQMLFKNVMGVATMI
jgi:hypothetical protein